MCKRFWVPKPANDGEFGPGRHRTARHLRRYPAAFWLVVAYALLSAFCFLPILDMLVTSLPQAEVLAPAVFLLGPPLTLTHGTKYLAAYFVETSVVGGLLLASWTLHRRDPAASTVLLMVACAAWIASAVLAVGVLL